ncbi:MAG: hypothetical protein AVDCRST_MAG50-1829, partial [uncultured Acidimicrobiales bacterium]
WPLQCTASGAARRSTSVGGSAVERTDRSGSAQPAAGGSARWWSCRVRWPHGAATTASSRA